MLRFIGIEALLSDRSRGFRAGLDMHMHVRQGSCTRTTVEIPDDQRARLLELAARRGEKGLSGIVQEAIEMYLRDQQNQARVKRAVGLRGRLSPKEADELVSATARIRKRWR